MKKIHQLFLITVLLCLPIAAFAEFNFNEIGLVTSSSYELRPTSEFENIMDEVIDQSPHKQILFYIHGRGRDAKDEFQMLKNLEARNNVRIIMFRWPSWSSLITRPVDNAQNSARELREVFYGLRKYKENHASLFKDKKVSLFLHSMGNIVLEEYTRYYHAQDLNSPITGKLFNNVAMIGADVGLYNHKEWVKQIDFSDRKYVAMNNQDIVLHLSNLLDLKNKDPMFHRLGLGFDKWKERRFDVSSYIDHETVYIDLSRSLRLDHRYFDSTKPNMPAIFSPLMLGEELNFDSLKLTRRYENGINYLMD